MCSNCGSTTKTIACIEAPVLIKQILDYLKHKAGNSESSALQEKRGAPVELPLTLFG